MDVCGDYLDASVVRVGFISGQVSLCIRLYVAVMDDDDACVFVVHVETSLERIYRKPK